jgi:two-component system, OmpR family, response regulator
MEIKTKIFLVDDDAVFIKTLAAEFLQHPGFEVETYSTGESCLENLSHAPDVIILDYHLDGITKGAMNGIETLDKIKEYNNGIPVIILSSQDKIEVAVKCMHHKAHDYIVKSETASYRLQKTINALFQMRKMEKELGWYMDRM